MIIQNKFSMERVDKAGFSADKKQKNDLYYKGISIEKILQKIERYPTS